MLITAVVQKVARRANEANLEKGKNGEEEEDGAINLAKVVATVARRIIGVIIIIGSLPKVVKVESQARVHHHGGGMTMAIVGTVGVVAGVEGGLVK